MNKIETIRKTRIFLLDVIKDLNTAELNEIPAGFNNNIIWNLGHMVAAQQGICYARAGLQTWIDEPFFAAYKPGSKPEAKLEEQEIERIKELLFTSLDQLDADLQKGLWVNYPAWTTRYGVAITTIDEALTFLLFHEGLHSGTITALKRVVQK